MAILENTRVRIKGTFLDTAGVPFDPTQVRLTVRLPSSAQRTYLYGIDGELVRDASGLFHLDLLCSFTGTVQYRWDSIATGQESAIEESFTVEAGELD